MLWRRKRHQSSEIAPEEIFLDASNAAGFDRGRFEGRIEQPLSRSTFVGLTTLLGLLFIVLVVRAGHLELVEGSAFAAQSAHNVLQAQVLFAPRGVITDRHGTVLAGTTVREDGSPGRTYPFPELGPVIGYVSNPKKDQRGVYYETTQRGIAGVEAEYDAHLTGTNGQLLTETDALGRVRSQGTIVPAEPGKTLVLTIDAGLQEKFSRAIVSVVREKDFIAGAGIILDVHTGAIRAIVSYPTYDPNVVSEGAPAGTIAGYHGDAGRPFLDHAVQGIYTPGSVVKPFIAAGALTDGLITPATIIDDPGAISLPDPYNPGKRYVFTGWKPLGLMDVRNAIAWSSDIFFYTVGGGFGSQKGLGIERLSYWYRQFGLGERTGVDLPEEAAGLIPTPEWKRQTLGEPWYTGDTYFTAIGQYSMQVTPIQVARATAALANGGRLVTPTLLAGRTPAYRLVPVTEDSLGVAREGMRLGVTEALAGALNLHYMKVAAKTGTAQTGTRNQYDNSWVEGFFPYEKPQYAFVVVLERGPAGTGSQAVNVMRRLFDSLYAADSPYVGGNVTTTQI